jgi:hypothetical protein
MVMKVSGRCHCGGIAFEADVDPATVGVCHCTDCQRLSGSAFRVSAPAPAATFKATGATPTVYIKVADSGARRAHAFCPTCGSPIYATAAGPNPQTYSLRVGTLNERAELPPRRQIWCASGLPWAQSLAGLESRPRQ